MAEEKKVKIKYSGAPFKIHIIKTRRTFEVRDGDVLDVTEFEVNELLKASDEDRKFELLKGSKKTKEEVNDDG